jgi:hypothetical protein
MIVAVEIANSDGHWINISFVLNIWSEEHFTRWGYANEKD